MGANQGGLSDEAWADMVEKAGELFEDAVWGPPTGDIKPGTFGEILGKQGNLPPRHQAAHDAARSDTPNLKAFESLDPVADLIRAYRMVEGGRYGPDPLARLSPQRRFEVDATLRGEDLDAAEDAASLMQQMTLNLADQMRRQEWELIESAAPLLRSGYTLCVHGTEVRIDEPDLSTDTVKLVVRSKAHLMHPGQVCELPGSGGRTQYGGVRRDVSLDDVMRWREQGVVQRDAHLRVGPAAWEAIQRRAMPTGEPIQFDGGFGSIMGVDVFTDRSMGDRWQLWSGRIMGQGELIAEGVEGA